MNKDIKLLKGIINILENYDEDYSDTDVEIINGLSRIFNSCIDATGRYHDDYGKFTNKIGWFVDGVINGTLKPLTNAIQIGEIQPNVISYLDKVGIKLGASEINLTYGKVKHTHREDKKENQKLSPDQIKRAENIIFENNVYYDTTKKNIIYISKLPPEEIKEDRNWIKIPINLNDEKGGNIVATMSIIPATTITDSPQIYKKID